MERKLKEVQDILLHLEMLYCKHLFVISICYTGKSLPR